MLGFGSSGNIPKPLIYILLWYAFGALYTFLYSQAYVTQYLYNYFSLEHMLACISEDEMQALQHEYGI